MHSMLKTVGGTIVLLQFICVVHCIDLDLLNKQASYLDAKVGSYAVFNCPLDFPQDIEIPYTLHWNKDVRYHTIHTLTHTPTYSFFHSFFFF